MNDEDGAGRDLSGLLDGLVTFEPRSVYWSCSACAAMVCDSDRARHVRAHRTLARELETRNPPN